MICPHPTCAHVEAQPEGFPLVGRPGAWRLDGQPAPGALEVWFGQCWRDCELENLDAPAGPSLHVVLPGGGVLSMRPLTPRLRFRRRS